jgi:hypothetical protein
MSVYEPKPIKFGPPVPIETGRRAVPIIQPSRSKLERQAANDARPRPSGYVCGACGEQHCECRPESGKCDPLDGLGAGIWRVVYVSLCVWAIVVTAILVIGRA